MTATRPTTPSIQSTTSTTRRTPAKFQQLTIAHEVKKGRAETHDTLVTIARELLFADAESAPGANGLTRGVGFDQVREIAERRHVVPERGCPSFGASVMKGAGGEPGEHRPSKHRLSNGRSIRVFRLRATLRGADPCQP